MTFKPHDEPRTIGWAAAWRDWKRFVYIRGGSGPRAFLAEAIENPSLWALWIYRYGYWVYHCVPSFLASPGKFLFHVLYMLQQILLKTHISPQADIGDDVWISPRGHVLIGDSSHVGAGSCLHGWNTFGMAANDKRKPRVGKRVHIGPGTSLIGPVSVPDDTVIGANSVIVTDIPESGAWIGTPAKKLDVAPERLIATMRRPRRAAARERTC